MSKREKNKCGNSKGLSMFGGERRGGEWAKNAERKRKWGVPVWAGFGRTVGA